VQSNFNPLYGQHHSFEVKQFLIGEIHKKFMYITKHLLNDKDFLVGNKFSIADIYLYIALGWAPYVGVELAQYPIIQTYFDRVKALPAVIRAQEKMTGNPSST
jgi:glutathione S-transferase